MLKLIGCAGPTPGALELTYEWGGLTGVIPLRPKTLFVVRQHTSRPVHERNGTRDDAQERASHSRRTTARHVVGAVRGTLERPTSEIVPVGKIISSVMKA
jgi:hypothetical protein